MFMKALFRNPNSMNSQDNFGVPRQQSDGRPLTLRVTRRDLDRRTATAVGGEQDMARGDFRWLHHDKAVSVITVLSMAVPGKCRLAGHRSLWVISDSNTIGRALWPRK
jgi:hypothetical protein